MQSLCSDSKCGDESHKTSIRHFHGDIVQCLMEASREMLQTGYNQIMGRNEVYKKAQSGRGSLSRVSPFWEA